MLSSALCWLTLQMGCRFLWLWGVERPHLPTDFQFGGIQEHTQITGLFILLQLFVVHHVTQHWTASMKYLQACQSTLLWWGLHNIKHWWWNDGNRPPQKGDTYIRNIYCRRHHVDKYNMEHTYIYIYTWWCICHAWASATFWILKKQSPLRLRYFTEGWEQGMIQTPRDPMSWTNQFFLGWRTIIVTTTVTIWLLVWNFFFP